MTQEVGRTRLEVRHVEVGDEHAGERLDRFLTGLLASVPRSRIYRLVRRGEVRVNGRRARPEQRLESSDRVRVPPIMVDDEPAGGGGGRPPPALLKRVEQSIAYEDERLIVIDKPAGIAVHGGSGLSFGIIEALRALRPEEQLELAHRLDRDTSGCLLIARRRSSLRTLHALLREGRVEKGYLALVRGQWNLGRHRIEAPLRTDIRVSGERTVKVHPSGKAAVSEFRPVQFFGSHGRSPRATLVEVALHTGRTHQIRVHAAHAGHPVAGDEKYGDPAFNAELRELGLERMFLHAHRVSFDWPGAGSFSTSAPLPSELRALIEQLEVGVRAPRGRGGGASPPPR